MDNESNSSKMLTVQDVYKDLGIGLQSVYQIFKDPNFPSILKGRKFLVSSIAYEEWKEKGYDGRKKKFWNLANKTVHWKLNKKKEGTKC